ncbi:Alpha/Beta hydrolase protein, partial [Stachybotrys elegans]
EPSTNLTWTPCFDNFTCARLEVPLDYDNSTLDTTSIAFIKLSGKNATLESPSIVLIPGGPGGSGINLLFDNQAMLGQALGEQYNFVSFDPRAVNNSGPSIDCFSGNSEARLAFMGLYNTGTANISAPSFAQQYYASSIYGEWCNNAVENGSPHGYYVTTPAVARDLLTFVEANARQTGQPPAEAKLWCYGISYGTVIGTTFASMFPGRIGRMVLDGVVDADQYYDNTWRDNIDQVDEAMGQFATLCHSAGPEACSFWGPTPANITSRIDAIIHQLQNHPVPISGVQGQELPTLVTYSDLKALFMQAVTSPLNFFPLMANILHQFERGDVSGLAGIFDALPIPDDAGMAIRCADSYRRNQLTTIEEFQSSVEHWESRSKYVGDMWPINHGSPSIGVDRPTSFPILFASNTIDPLSPVKSARKMSSRFPGSVLLTQEAVGHVIVNGGGSTCYFGNVQAYLQGIVPSANTTCAQENTPFAGSAI